MSLYLYKDCFDFNKERIIEYLNTCMVKVFNTKLINQYIYNNEDLIINYINKYQPKSFKDYIEMTPQQLAQLVQKETVAWVKNNIKTIIDELSWPRDRDTMLYDIYYKPNLNDYFFINEDDTSFNLFNIVCKVCPNYKKLRYVNFGINTLYKKFNWNKTFAQINSILQNYIKEKNNNIINKRRNHRLKINKLEDSNNGKEYIDFDPQIPFLRDAPIVVIHNFKDNTDHVLIGDYGQHHNDVLNQYPELRNNCKNKDGVEVFNCAYLHGLIAILSTNEHNGYNSLQEVADIIKREEPNILKVFISSAPRNQSGILKQARLAKRIF